MTAPNDGRFIQWSAAPPKWSVCMKLGPAATDIVAVRRRLETLKQAAPVICVEPIQQGNRADAA